MATNGGAMAGSSNPATNLGKFSSSSLRRLAMNSLYHDRSHLQYYAGALKVYCGKKAKLEKQKLKGLAALHDGSLSEKRTTKLLELVSMDLVALSNKLSESGDAEKPLVEQVRQQIFSEALEVLMTQLQQEKAERKQRKEEKKLQKAAAKAQKMQMRKCEQSSSSSSESSDSECEKINMANFRMNRISEQVVCPDIMPVKLLENPLNIGGLDLEFAQTKEKLGLNGVDIEGQRQVQVCMGGKCKKLGSEQLLAAFEESIQKSGMGCSIQAVGCKCMGKCKTAPNVKTQNEFCKELHVSVGVGDVDLVLDHHFGLKQEKDELKDKILVQS